MAALRQVTLKFPPKDLWDTLISDLGPAPDIPKLKRAWEQWRKAGNSPTNYGWLDWYKKAEGQGHGDPRLDELAL